MTTTAPRHAALPSVGEHTSPWTTWVLGCLVVLALAAVWPVAIGAQDAVPAGALILASIGGTVVTVAVRTQLLERALRRPELTSRWMRHVGSQLVPVVALSLVYPLAQGRLTLDSVGGTDLRTLLLSVSLTVPWLGQTVCMPLYDSITSTVPQPAADRAVLARALADRLPGVFAAGAVITAGVTGAVTAVLGWSATAALAFLALALLHVLFMQLLVLVVLGRRPALWAASWLAYAAAVLLVPDLWWLPPLVAASLLAAALVRDLPSRPVPVRTPDVATEFAKGALLGAVLWADKLVLFLRDPSSFPATVAFASLVPALITYNYYFGRVAPQVDALVATLRSSMQGDVPAVYAEHKRTLTVFVAESTKTVLLLGAALTSTGALVLPLVTGQLTATAVGAGADASTAVTIGMLLCGWVAVIVTLLAYKLAYLGRHSTAYGFCAAYGAANLVCTLAGAALAPTYVALTVLGLGVLVPLLQTCMRHWQHPDYSLFWRNAVSW